MFGMTQPLAPLEALSSSAAPLNDAVLVQPRAQSFSDALGTAIDSLSNALDGADALAVAVAQRKTDIADAAVARAKADVMLEVAAIGSAKISGAITQLLQTQL
jgi:flagellar hook-basal body complex protein FliE